MGLACERAASPEYSSNDLVSPWFSWFLREAERPYDQRHNLERWILLPLAAGSQPECSTRLSLVLSNQFMIIVSERQSSGGVRAVISVAF